MNQRTLYITFDGQQIAISSRSPEVLWQVERYFREMLTTEPGILLAYLEVCYQNNVFLLLVNSQITAQELSLSDLIYQIKYQVIRHLMEARSNLLWFHAGAAALGETAIMFSGLSGRGKSTLVVNLCDRGWKYLSDDILPLNIDTGQFLPFPQMPKVRENVKQQLSSDCLDELKQVDIQLKSEIICRKAMSVKAIIFPYYCYNSPTELLSFSRANAALDLLQNCLNFLEHQEKALSYVAELVKSTPTFTLVFNDGSCATDLIEKMEILL
jgi:hypothetical protein